MSTKTLRIPSTLYRTATFDRSGIDEEKRTVEMSISTDAPYERYFGKEILDHSPGCVKMERMMKGAPLLFNHDRNAHLGRIIEAETDGKRLRVKAQFGNSALAKEKWEDVKSGILQETSVGYQVERMVLEEESEKDGDTYRVTDWMPFEGSLVTIPADVTCGVGRADETKDFREIEILNKSKQNACNGPDTAPIATQPPAPMPEATPTPTVTIDPKSERNAAVAEFKARCQKIDSYVAGIKNPQWQKAASEIAAKHKSGDAIFEDFRAEALDAFEGVTRVDAQDKGIGMSERDINEFSLLRACRQLSLGKGLEGLEREVSNAAAKNITDAKPNAIYLPADITGHRSLATRAQTAGSFAAGGATVQNQYGSMIEYLRNKTVLGQLGVTQINGLAGDFVMPVQTGGVTFAWVSETGALSDSEATFGQKTMTPHRGGATTPYSTQFLAQSSLSAEQFFRNELMTATALGIDLAGLEGTGVSGQPLGVKNTTGINSTVTYGGAATWADIVEHETGIAVDNADIGSMGFAISAAACGKWKTILRDSVAGAGYLIDNGMTANGYPVVRTNQITGSISFFGVWSQLLHAMWSTQEVIVDPYALKKSGQVEVTLNTFHDFLVRQPLAFNVSTDSAAQ